MFKEISTERMCNGRLFGTIFWFALPIMLSNLLQLFYNAADLIIVGQFCGTESVAAVGSTGSLASMIITFFVNISVGAGVVVAQNLGAGKPEEVSKVVHAAFPISLIGGVAVALFGFFAALPLLRITNVPSEVLDLAVLYLRIYFIGAVFSLPSNVAAAVLRAVGDTKSPLLIYAFSGAMNVGMNLLFVLGFGMDVAGVALATMLANGIAAVMMMHLLSKRRDACRLRIKKFHIHKDALSKMLRIGIPGGIQGIIISAANVFVQAAVNGFGTIGIAGDAAAASLSSFVGIGMASFSQVGMTIGGQNFGAGKFDRIKRIFGICIVQVLMIWAVMCVIFFFFGKPLLTLYITEDAAFQFALLRVTVLTATYFLCGFLEITSGILRGMDASFMVMIFNILGIGLQVLFLQTIFRIPSFHTPLMLYLSFLFDWIPTFLIQGSLIFILVNRYKKLNQ